MGTFSHLTELVNTDPKLFSNFSQTTGRILFFNRGRHKIIEHLKSMLDKDINVPSVVISTNLSLKKDGTVRYCIDFRGVNKVAKKMLFRYQTWRNALTLRRKNAFMSTLDMAQGYH